MKNKINKICLTLSIAGFFSINITAQNKSETSLELSYFKKGDRIKYSSAMVKVKNEEEKFVSAKNVRVNFYVIADKELQFIKSVNTDSKGRSIIFFEKDDLPLDDSLYFTIVAKIENDTQYEDAEERVYYKNATLTINLNQQDSINVANTRVTEIDKDGKEIPVKEAEIKIYVQRLFGMMQAAEENTITTDENGEAIFVFPENIPGDTTGRITVLARMEDNEQFGNVENEASAPWGITLIKEKDPFPRALWEPSAPIPLVITVSALFGGVWCVYLIIFYQMHKINKEGKAEIN